MKRYTVFVLLVAAALLAACDQVIAFGQQFKPEAQSTGVSDIPATAVYEGKGEDKTGGAAIVFHRSGGIAGVDETWKIYPDGKIENAAGATQVDAAKVAALLSEIEELGFFEMKESYGGLAICNDCFTYELTVVSGEKAKTVMVRGVANDVPAELGQIIEKINQLVAPQQ